MRLIASVLVLSVILGSILYALFGGKNREG